MEINLTENEMKLLVDLLEKKLEEMSVLDSSDRFDYGVLQAKLEILLKK